MVSFLCHCHCMILGPVLMTSHDQNSHTAPCFDYLDLTNAVVPLMMSLASKDLDVSASSTT